jgi:hypothetical protein
MFPRPSPESADAPHRASCRTARRLESRVKALEEANVSLMKHLKEAGDNYAASEQILAAAHKRLAAIQ